MHLPLSPDHKKNECKIHPNELSHICEYFAFKSLTPSENFDYDERETIDVKVKIHNWNVVRLSNYLTLMICNGRDENYNNYVFETQFFYTQYYTEDELKNELTDKLLSMKDSNLWDVHLTCRKNQRVFSLDNSNKYYSFNNLQDILDLKAPDYHEDDVYMLQTNFYQPPDYTSIRKDYSLQHYRDFFALNNIKPNATYHIKANVRRNKKNSSHVSLKKSMPSTGLLLTLSHISQRTPQDQSLTVTTSYSLMDVQLNTKVRILSVSSSISTSSLP